MLGVRMFQTKPHPLMQARYRLQYYHVRFARPITNARFVRFAAKHCPGVFDLPDETSRAARYWTEWNRSIERAASAVDLPYHRFRIEELDDELLATLDRDLGGDATIAQAAQVHAELGTSTHRARQVDALGLDAIQDEPTRHNLVVLARAYGYDL
jgi:hypothetical protein